MKIKTLEDLLTDELKDLYSAETQITHFNRSNVEANTFSTDFIKLREARLDYTLTPKILGKLHSQKATIGIYGRDLFMITNWPAYDPEFGTLNNGEINAGFEIGQFPPTRSYGVNLTFSF